MSLSLLAGCTLADSFDYHFGDGGAAGDLARSSDGAAFDGAVVPDGGTADASGPCGLPGQVCCQSAGGAQCAGGGCCSAAQRCIASGDDFPTGTSVNQVCLDGTPTTCGGGGQPCCGRDTCANSGCCVGGACVGITGVCSAAAGTCGGATCADLQRGNCGGLGDPCCSGAPSVSGAGPVADFCVASGLACNPTTARCEQCGGAAGQLCCEGNGCAASACCSHSGALPTCVMPGASCGSTEGACAGGGCAGCGRVGEPCCGDGIGCTAPLAACVSGQCVSCGGRGQACCPGDNNGGYCSEPYACNGQTKTCAHCGRKDERCCPGDVCEQGLGCQGSTCT